MDWKYEVDGETQGTVDWSERIRLGVQLLGVAAVLVGLNNFFLWTLLDTPLIFPEYHYWFATLVGLDRLNLGYYADWMLIGIGTVIALLFRGGSDRFGLDILKINANTLGVQTRGWLLTLVRLVGVVAFIIGAYNFIFAPLTGDLLFGFYRGLVDVAFIGQAGLVSLADILLMAAGAAVAWFI